MFLCCEACFNLVTLTQINFNYSLNAHTPGNNTHAVRKLIPNIYKIMFTHGLLPWYHTRQHLWLRNCKMCREAYVYIHLETSTKQAK